MIDATLTCEDANSKPVELVTVADVDAEDHVGNSLLIWELEFVQDFLPLMFLEVIKLNLGQVFEARFVVKILNFKFIGDADVKLMLSRDFEDEI